MNAFIKSVKSTSVNEKHAHAQIRKAITTQLSESVKEIQLCGVEENILSYSLDVEEATNSLCSVVEAMFLHGIKDSLACRFRKVIADIDRRPEPNFWAPLLVISHRQIITQITDSTQLTTEVGQCRAWIRLALNECMLSSYLMTLRQDPAIIKCYYNTYAYVRDGDLLEVAQKFIEGVEAIKTFTLPCQSSILNSWPQTTLILAGIWSPTLRTCPVQLCVDVAQSSQPTSIGNSESASLGSMLSLNSRSSGIGQIIAFNEDEAFKTILKENEEQDLPTNNSQEQSVSEALDSESKSIENDSSNYQIESNLGNSLSRRTGWSFDENQVSNEQNAEVAVKETPTETILKENVKSLEHSYNALIDSYNMFTGEYIKTPGLREVWERFENRENEITDNSSQIGNVNNENGSLVIEISNQIATTKEPISLTAQIGLLAREKGLDTQNYECAGCRTSIGLRKKYRTCAFTGDYFCDDCMSKERIIIPARVVHNWDYEVYEVSQKAFNCIEEVKNHPVIDLKTLNPFIYSAVEDMARLQILRNQLNFLRAYLYTCRENIIEQLQKKLWPREYLYEHIHQYSVTDLQQIPDGSLAAQLKEVIDFGKKHVYECWLCKNKGFLCELCEKSNTLFPFEVENVYRCDVCYAVYHIGCLNSSKPCPKCKRKKEREEDLGLLGVTMT